MTSFDSEFAGRQARPAADVFRAARGPAARNRLSRIVFAKSDARAARPAFRYPLVLAATGGTTAQVVSVEGSTPASTPRRRAISHCEVTEWHRAVTWEMRNGNSSHPQRRGGYDGHRD